MVEYVVRVLHISDLHARQSLDWRTQQVLGDAWKQNLDELLAEGRFDLVCMTGDLAFSGHGREYEHVTAFLRGTMERLELPMARLFVVPGNHDVRRGVRTSAWAALRKHITHHDAAAFSQWMAGGWAPRGIDDQLRTQVRERQGPYRRWLSSIGRSELLPKRSPHQRLGYRVSLRLPERPFDVHVVGFDSAWLAGDDGDARNLWLTDDQVMRLAAGEGGAPLSGYRLGLIHHPLTDLADGERCRRLLASPAAGTGPLLDLLLRGHLHETELNTWSDPDRSLCELAAGCLYEHNTYPNACVALTVTLDERGRPLRYAMRARAWSGRGHWHDDDSLYRGSVGGRITWQLAPSPRSRRTPPRVFVGRADELAALTRLIDGGPVAVCAVQGMPGVGKSYLVDRFAALNQGAFPGGYERLVLEPNDARTADDLRDTLRDRMQLSADRDPWSILRERLRRPRTLVHVENVDSRALANQVAGFVRQLDGCAIVVTGRFRTLGRAAGWRRVELSPFAADDALAQLSAELGEAETAAEAEARQELVGALGGLPLALHLAAGYLAAGHSAAGFLRKLRRERLGLEPSDPADPVREQGEARVILRTTFEISLACLREALGEDAELLMAGLAALGHAPAAGVGASLGAAIAGLTADEYEQLRVEACALSILDPVSERAEAVSMHPLLAERVREDCDAAQVLGRMTEWFLARLPEIKDTNAGEQGRRWGEVHAETAALMAWLAEVPEADCARVERAGSRYAMRSGPFLVWAAFCERCVRVATDEKQRSHALWTLSHVTERAGELDRVLQAAEAKARLDQERGDERGVALARGLAADVLYARGDADEALRIWREEELPVYERLGDVRSRAVTMGKIADVLYARGDADEALRIRREEQLPVYERLGDVRERAVTMGQIADVLYARGDADEALRIWRAEALPVLERLGDVRERAVAMGRIADVLYARGDADEALRIWREEVLPAFERLSEERSRAVAMGRIADVLYARGDADEALRIRREEELPVYERLGDVRERAVTMGKIADVLYARGDADEALRIRREETLPVLERLGGREFVIARANLAMMLLERQRPGDQDEAAALLCAALSDAQTMEIPEAETIRAMMTRYGIDE